MKALVERLDALRELILDQLPEGAARDQALDLVIEATAIAEALPEIAIVARPESRDSRPMSRVIPNVRRPAWDAVFNGGRTS